MRAVVSGAAGFIGSHLCDRLLERGCQVVGVDNFVTGSPKNLEHLDRDERFALVEHDISEPIRISGPVDLVLHLASPASPRDFPAIPIQIVKVGTLGTHNMLGLARANNARFLLASTSEVYGDPVIHPQPETYWGNVNPIGPRGCYDEAKRCAEAFTMAYHRAHGLDTRIVRIFNSILADEQVLYDDGTGLKRERVETLAKRLGGRIDLYGHRVPSFNCDGMIETSSTTALVGHPVTSDCFEVRTRYGRSVRVTGDHSLFVEGRNGQPEPKPVRDLKVGNRIAVASRLKIAGRDRKEVDMIQVWDCAGLDPWNLLVRHPALSEIVYRRRFEVFAAIASRHHRSAPRWRSFVWGEIARHRERGQLPLGALRELSIPIPEGTTVRQRTAGKSAELPRRIQLTNDFLWLLGLYVAEGCRLEGPSMAYIGLSASFELLNRAAEIVSRDLGLPVVWAKATMTRSPSIYVHSRLLLLLLDHLGFGGGQKGLPGWVLSLPLTRLKWVIEGYREGDGVHSGKKVDEGKRHEFSTISTDLKDDLIVALARFGLLACVGSYETTFRQRTGERRYPFWRLTICNVTPWSPLEWDAGVTQRLNARRTGDLVWASISGITEVNPTPLVYDFCVPGRENFWAGSGVMAHNTHGPRMRIDDGRVIPNYLTQALRGEPLTVYGDGSQTRSITYVDDLVRGILAVLDGQDPMPFNLGTQDEITMLELARLIKRISGSPSEIVFRPLPQDDPKQRRPDTTRARTILGWEPLTPMEDGLRSTLEYFRSALR